MSEAAQLARDLAAVLLLVLAAELVALLIVCVQALRNPRGKEPASRWPDYIPDDFGGGPNETRSGDPRPGPYDRNDDYPGWGIPDGDTQPSTDTPSGDRGVGGESS